MTREALRSRQGDAFGAGGIAGDRPTKCGVDRPGLKHALGVIYLSAAPSHNQRRLSALPSVPWCLTALCQLRRRRAYLIVAVQPDRACWGPSPGPGETIHQRAFTTSRIVELFVRDQGIDLEYQLVDLFTGAHKHPDFEKLNPNRLAPVLEDGDFFLTESSAIVKYIAEKCGSAAYPKNLQARTQVNEMMAWFNANFYKDFGYGFIYPQLYPLSQACHWCWTGWCYFVGEAKSSALAEDSWRASDGAHNNYLCGDTITLADYQGAEIISLGDLIRCEYPNFPNVSRWINTMRSLPSWGTVNAAAEDLAASLKEKTFIAL
jgi:glutathione S-transferase